MDGRPAPYPADTRAKGWRFEIDYEKVEQSDTWSLAAEIPMAQPALVMMWLMAWKETPVGSYPNDENLIRAKCKLPPAVWAKVREVCMRGWWLAADGRLYHDTIVQRVEAMLAKRAKDAARTANNRARRADSDPSHTGVTRDTPVTHAIPAREFDTKHQAPVTTPSDEGVEPRKRVASAIPRPEDVSPQVWADWLQLRKSKKAPVTETVLTEARAEAAKAFLPLERFLSIWCARGSQGLQADWLKPEERGSRPVNGSSRPTSHHGIATKDFSEGVSPDGRLL